ncbi:uncharacterized protein E0L32_008902 [Thyridium curvatum]|uniref:Alcohol dehydrogenase n=1 Tax=Thyridium curvatum TaxID=1093900 RepID=A0A507B041_9PEZI|nr:uncharacterized protein E0L32_008902 [Thyridium curvatum]TPX09880.1 hypothetical protein E0L32_008902 [Thyridium curvatum]
MDSIDAAIPATHKALLLNSTRDPYDIAVVQRPTPKAGPGSAVLRVLAVGVLTYAGKVYSGRKPYPYPTPLVPGLTSIGRVSAVGPDATVLKPGQLVFFDCFINGRDSPEARCLSGLSAGMNAASNVLLEGEWRDSTFAEYAKVPLENCHLLNEARLCGSPADGGLGYTIEDLAFLFYISVPFGGLRSVNVQAGEKVIVTPATGAYGSAAVLAALAMGAQVIAMGRDAAKLEKIKAYGPKGRIRTVLNTGDMDADIKELTRDGPADVFFDISPGKAFTSTHFRSCIHSLRLGGRVSMMGVHDGLPMPMMHMLINDITLKPRWMYSVEDMRVMIRLLEAGYLSLRGIRTVGTFPLEQFSQAFDAAAEMAGPCVQVLITP